MLRPRKMLLYHIILHARMDWIQLPWWRSVYGDVIGGTGTKLANKHVHDVAQFIRDLLTMPKRCVAAGCSNTTANNLGFTRMVFWSLITNNVHYTISACQLVKIFTSYCHSNSLSLSAFNPCMFTHLSSSTVLIPFWTPSSVATRWTSPFHSVSFKNGCLPLPLTFIRSGFNASSGCVIWECVWLNMKRHCALGYFLSKIPIAFFHLTHQHFIVEISIWLVFKQEAGVHTIMP